MSAKIDPRVMPLMVCWMKRSNQFIGRESQKSALGSGNRAAVQSTFYRTSASPEHLRVATTRMRTHIALLTLGRDVAGTPRPRDRWANFNSLIGRYRDSSSPALFQGLREFELASDGPVRLAHLKAGHDFHRRIAVRVEAPLAVEAVEVLGG